MTGRRCRKRSWLRLSPSCARNSELLPGRPRCYAGPGRNVASFTRIIFFVDVVDEPSHREFFLDFKERLKVRFAQLDVWITSHPIDVI